MVTLRGTASGGPAETGAEHECGCGFLPHLRRNRNTRLQADTLFLCLSEQVWNERAEEKRQKLLKKRPQAAVTAALFRTSEMIPVQHQRDLR